MISRKHERGMSEDAYGEAMREIDTLRARVAALEAEVTVLEGTERYCDEAVKKHNTTRAALRALVCEVSSCGCNNVYDGPEYATARALLDEKAKSQGPGAWTCPKCGAVVHGAWCACLLDRERTARG